MRPWSPSAHPAAPALDPAEITRGPYLTGIPPKASPREDRDNGHAPGREGHSLSRTAQGNPGRAIGPREGRTPPQTCGRLRHGGPAGEGPGKAEGTKGA